MFRNRHNHSARWAMMLMLCAFAAPAWSQAPPVPGAPLGMPGAAPMSGGPPGVPVMPGMPGAPGATAAAKEDPPNNAKPQSLFFTPEELEKLRLAMLAYEKSKNMKTSDAESKANDFLNQLTGNVPKDKEPKEKSFTYPQYFLQSLVYHTPTDWAVSINGRRFEAGKAQENSEIKVLDVDNEKVSLEWKPVRMDRLRDTLAIVPPSIISPQIIVDLKHELVAFTLRPNQTFSSYVMRILEGKVQPFTLNLTPDEKGKEGDAANPLPPGISDILPKGPNDTPPPAPKNNTPVPENITSDDIKNDVGINALNKTYKRMGLEK